MNKTTEVLFPFLVRPVFASPSLDAPHAHAHAHTHGERKRRAVERRRREVGLLFAGCLLGQKKRRDGRGSSSSSAPEDSDRPINTDSRGPSEGHSKCLVPGQVRTNRAPQRSSRAIGPQDRARSSPSSAKRMNLMNRRVSVSPSESQQRLFCWADQRRERRGRDTLTALVLLE